MSTCKHERCPCVYSSCGVSCWTRVSCVGVWDDSNDDRTTSDRQRTPLQPHQCSFVEKPGRDFDGTRTILHEIAFISGRPQQFRAALIISESCAVFCVLLGNGLRSSRFVHFHKDGNSRQCFACCCTGFVAVVVTLPTSCSLLKTQRSRCQSDTSTSALDRAWFGSLPPAVDSIQCGASSSLRSFARLTASLLASKLGTWVDFMTLLPLIPPSPVSLFVCFLRQVCLLSLLSVVVRGDAKWRCCCRTTPINMFLPRAHREDFALRIACGSAVSLVDRGLTCVGCRST